ncbi:MAG: hypothetical protein KF777_07085 [Planctomycetaceae bacterium]|nr:hypothetical protein [Planctomycetaceae bacterium]
MLSERFPSIGAAAGTIVRSRAAPISESFAAADCAGIALISRPEADRQPMAGIASSSSETSSAIACRRVR